MLVKPACLEALLEALERVAGDAGLRARLGGRACETARRYGWDEVGRAYLAVLDRAARKRGPH